MDTALQALAEPNRRKILRLVWNCELPAGAIAEHFSISRPAVSQHLRVLRTANLVQVRSEGTRRYYRADPSEVEQVLAFLGSFWTSSDESQPTSR